MYIFGCYKIDVYEILRTGKKARPWWAFLAFILDLKAH